MLKLGTGSVSHLGPAERRRSVAHGRGTVQNAGLLVPLGAGGSLLPL
jgi:hypothetical protein